MNKDPAPSYLVALDGIGDGDGRLADEPHITIHTTMISEVELVLLLARRVVLIVAVVGLHGDETLIASFHTFFR